MKLVTSNAECVLRSWEPGDEPSLVHHINNRSVWRNLTHRCPHPYTLKDAEAWLSVANEPSSSVHLAIVFQGEAVGGIGAIAGEGVFARTAELGYWLGEQYWNRGLASVATKSLVQHLRSRSHFARLQAAVFAWNPHSARVLEKVGFARESTLKQSVFEDGELIDSFMYALLTGA